MEQLRCKNLVLGYGNNIVSKGISFSVNKGDYTCIIGENGTGKTTLMKSILGLNKQISGEIIFSDRIKKNNIGYLPQQTQLQRDFPASVKEVVMSGFLNHCGINPFYTIKQKNKFKRIMDNLNISRLEKRCYRELSGGQQQKVLLARALCATDKLLLLDEPVAALDPKASKEFYQLISKINSQGTTIIMISHDVDVAINFASHIVDMNKPYFFGTREEYISKRIGGEQNV